MFGGHQGCAIWNHEFETGALSSQRYYGRNEQELLQRAGSINILLARDGSPDFRG